MSVSFISFLRWGRIAKVGCYCPVCLKRVDTVSIKKFNPDEQVVLSQLKRHCRWNCGHSKTLKLGQLFLYFFREREIAPDYATSFENITPRIKDRAPDARYIREFGNKRKLLASMPEIVKIQGKMRP